MKAFFLQLWLSITEGYRQRRAPFEQPPALTLVQSRFDDLDRRLGRTLNKIRQQADRTVTR